MRVKWNLPVEGHGSVTWNFRRDVLIVGHGNVVQRRRGNVPPQPHWVFYLEFSWDVVVSFLWDVATTFLCEILEKNQCDVLTTFHWDVDGCFIWDLPATSMEQTEIRRQDIVMTSSCRVGNRLFFLSLKNGDDDPIRNSFDTYYMPLVEIKYFNALIYNKPFSDQPIKKEPRRVWKTCRNVKKWLIYNRKFIWLFLPWKI